MHISGHTHSPPCECDFLYFHKFWCFQSSQWTSLSLVITFKFLVRLLFAPSVIHCLRHDVRQLLLIISNKFSQARGYLHWLSSVSGSVKKNLSENHQTCPEMMICLFQRLLGCWLGSVDEGCWLSRLPWSREVGVRIGQAKMPRSPLLLLSFSHLFLNKCSPD